MPSTTPPVFLVEEVPASGDLVLDGEEARHAATVRRMRAGERLVVSDGRGSAAECVIAGVRPRCAPVLDLSVSRRWTEPGPAVRVVVAQALAKGDRGELAVELTTEAGADEILPWRAERSVVRWEEGPRGAKALARWQNTARAAAKQARRAWVPPVREPVTTAQLAEVVARAACAVVLEGSASRRLTSLSLPEAGDVVLVVGPEGGITDGELETLTAAGAVGVRLGPTVLRTSTAAAVALGALGAMTSRWA
ncbi:16S rRNA (uracil(1498)-N(3))-methyltransferase [Amycolatopsis ruanii]|uniref:16S rRNA (uracil(1498)-N(3))-methyltransferase n=1 Tax=Amycolatopsis ruanii TaxID=944491 RepID=UPI000E287DF8|nr:16S rRNA (uracil(1498)-N(3))-methyltransferase [Amycolatopsis ruanii]